MLTAALSLLPVSPFSGRFPTDGNPTFGCGNVSRCAVGLKRNFHPRVATGSPALQFLHDSPHTSYPAEVPIESCNLYARLPRTWTQGAKTSKVVPAKLHITQAPSRNNVKVPNICSSTITSVSIQAPWRYKPTSPAARMRSSLDRQIYTPDTQKHYKRQRA
jgi:hypothetical protein